MKSLATIILLSISPLILGQGELKIVSWNLHLLPSPVFVKSKKKLRVDSIVNHFTNIDTSADLLLFQEVFHNGRRKQLLKGLEKTYPFHTPVTNPATLRLFKTNSGLIIFSKTPIIQMNSVKFEECSSSDCMAFKGAQFIHTVWNNVPLLIINTHLNSEPPRSIALEQTKMIVEKLIEPLKQDSIPVFIGGDFNINCNDAENYKKLLSIVQTKNTLHQNAATTSSIEPLTNTLDYLFIYKNQLPSYFNLDYVYKYQIGPSWTDSDKKKVYGKTVGFSDHYPVMMQLTFDK